MKKIIIFFGLVLMVSCGDTAMEKPDNLIEKDVMIAILYDIAVLQATENTNAALFQQNGIQPGAFIYKKYNIDSLTFAQSNRYYATDPQQYKEMFGMVYHQIEQKQLELNQKSVQETGKAIAPSDAPAIQ
ncbi:DUF4296 domain-containing protein [Flavobacterium enshiense]|uniref:DUF4296 domain-containing protein n=1 Tax=Flavobacterium enshiense TaxID=1341165 RepID=UPI00345DCA5F